MSGMSTRASTSGSRAVRFDSAEQEVYLNLWRTYDRLRGLEDAFFETYELTGQQYNVLRLLRAGNLPTLQLAQRLVSRAPDITRMVDALEKRGLVTRERKPENRRTVLVAITEAGRTLLREIAGPLRACHEHQLGHLTEAQLTQLRELLQAARFPHEEADSAWK